MTQKCTSLEELANFVDKEVNKGYQVLITAAESFDLDLVLNEVFNKVKSLSTRIDNSQIGEAQLSSPIIGGRFSNIVEDMTKLSSSLSVIMLSYSEEMLKKMTTNNDDFNTKISRDRSYNEIYAKTKEGSALRAMGRENQTKISHILIDIEIEPKDERPAQVEETQLGEVEDGKF